MIDLIKDNKPWTKNQIRKRTESYIKQVGTHGDEQLLTRVNDAYLLGLRPITESETAFRNEQYLPRAVAAGQLAEQMSADNERLIVVLANEQALRDFVRIGAVLSGDYAPAETLENELGEVVPNSEYTSLVAAHTAAEAVVVSLTNDDWQLLAQRSTGAAIEDVELHVAVVGMVPTLAALTQYVEGLELAAVDGRMTLANAKADVVSQLVPPEPEVPDV